MFSDEDTIREMVREIDLKEAQMQFAEVTARMVQAQTTDPQLCKESEARLAFLAKLGVSGLSLHHSGGDFCELHLSFFEVNLPNHLADRVFIRKHQPSSKKKFNDL